MAEEYYQELCRLKSLSSVPSVQKVLDDLINDRLNQQKQQIIREPIKRTKAEVQTIYITTGYGWSQNDASITLYVNFKDANEIPRDKYTLKVLARTVELNIHEFKGANHNFKINQLYDKVNPDKTIIKFKEGKIVIMLKKFYHGSDWPELRVKTTQEIYNKLEKFEQKYKPTVPENFNTPFTESPSPPACPNHDDFDKKEK